MAFKSSQGIKSHMGDDPQAPWLARWIGAFLREIPAPNDSWAEIIGHIAWPTLALFLIFRFRRFLSTLLLAIADRIRTDHVKIGWFEIRPNDQVIVLDAEEAAESTLELDPSDIQRIERMFEFLDDGDNFWRLVKWIETDVSQTVDIEDFLTLPIYASDRARAFEQVEGLAE